MNSAQSVEFDGRPSPHPDYVSEPFFKALDEGHLVVQECVACDAFQLGELICNQCCSPDLRWVRASGRGTIHSFATVHLSYHPAFAVPYAVISVELLEGPRLLANLADCNVRDVRVGMPVVMRPSKLASGVTVPIFVPA